MIAEFQILPLNANPRQPSGNSLDSYSTDVEGGALVAVQMRVSGSLGSDYLRFVGERARWLNLSGWVVSREPGRAEIVVEGPEALVGALEMACVLGPLETLVDSILIEAIDGDVPSGFVVR